MEHKRVYLSEGRSGTIICSKCGRSRPVNFPDEKIPIAIGVRCSCGYAFQVDFEKRKYYRKSVQIVGKCAISGDAEDDSYIVITNLSQGGMRAVKKNGKLPKVDETLRIGFTINGTKLNCLVSICDVKGDQFGAIFQDLDEHSKKTLGFFLLP